MLTLEAEHFPTSEAVHFLPLEAAQNMGIESSIIEISGRGAPFLFKRAISHSSVTPADNRQEDKLIFPYESIKQQHTFTVPHHKSHHYRLQSFSKRTSKLQLFNIRSFFNTTFTQQHMPSLYLPILYSHSARPL